jgi:membrane-associated phospholipid phosphatase
LFPVRHIIFLFLLMLIPHPSSGQDTSVSSFPGDLLDDITALPTLDNTWWLLGGAAATILAHEIEDPEGATRFLNQPVIDPLADFGNIWGDIRVQAPLALGCWAVGSWQGSEEFAGLGYDLSRGLLLTYTVTGVIKHTVHRTRPNGESKSFPSGHTAAAFTTAGVLSRRYGGWIGGAGIGLGVLAGLGRMEDMKHYASDVVAGATIGWIVGRTVAREGSPDDSAWRIVPSGKGVVLVGRF